MKGLEDVVELARLAKNIPTSVERNGHVLSRRNFIKDAASAVFLAGLPNVAHGRDGALTTDSNGNFVNDFIGFLDAKYSKGDFAAMFGYQERLRMRHGISPLELHKSPDRHLLTRGLFMLDYRNGPDRLINLFKIDKQDDFKSFKDDAGNDRSDIFEVPFNPHRVAYLGEILWSTDRNAMFAGYKKIPDIGAVIGIPYLQIAKPFIAFGDDVVKGKIESCIIHELGHILFRTPDEEFAMLVEFGYRLEKGVRICGIGDINRYLTAQKNLRQTHETIAHLDEIFLQDPNYGNFKYHARGRNSIANDVQRKVEELHKMNKIHPNDPMKISDKQFYATAALILRNHPLLVRAKSTYAC